MVLVDRKKKLDEDYECSDDELQQSERKESAFFRLFDNIQRSEDKNNFNFRMNFVMLFVIVLVECTKNGRMKEDIVRYFYSGTDFSKFDWCDFIVDKTRGCKSGWLRCDNRSPFNGPLTILTLLYVNSIDCKGLKVDPTKQPITFWTKAMLRRREKPEIRDGGFGKGKRREVMRVEELASEDGVQQDMGQ
ncbi:hypothetical protein E3N88_38420 [Mikania micrantha]|uniref:Uncharacterized protein n=1 Tax=Mikania micrantha TaxID=192012 RepID=A0A5N6LU00_9ASTR|nr:hypothetical protein E3N88_38420 [Mikania micrantha]